MSEVSLTGHIVVSTSDLANVVAELPKHIELTRAEPGCLQFEVVVDPDNATIYHVSERFASKAAFESHQDRVRSSTWGIVTRDVERHYKITGIDD